MRDKQFKKLLKEEFEKNNKCPVELSDVLPEENFKNLNDILYNKYKKQQKLSKYFSLSSLITVLVLIVSVIGFSITLGDYHSKLANSPILSDEARDYMIDYCDGENNVKIVCVEYIRDNKYVAIYSNIKVINEEKHILLFYIKNFEEKVTKFICNGNYEVHTNEIRYGYIYDFGIEGTKPIEIEIITNEDTRKIIIN
ncbi:MAG: hypothetical protein E7166_06970 [Firmicutes bacterium]|nr:hypothetical protein [Bacillota bacterium]